jgi:hypothetical protein
MGNPVSRLTLFYYIFFLFFLTLELECSKGKAIPLHVWAGLEHSRRLRLLSFKVVGTCRWYGSQPYALTAFTPQEILVVLIMPVKNFP